MSRKFPLLSLFLLFLLACGSAAPKSTPTPPPSATPKPPPTLSASQTALPPLTPVCLPSAEPTEEDIDRALSFTGSLFSAWKRSYSVSENRAAVSWTLENKLAYLEALIYPCGYEEPDVNAYYSEENWKTIFANYESYQPGKKCRDDAGLRLYQFSAQNLGFEYDVRYWVQNDTDNRLIGLMLVFPADERGLLEEYSARLFPHLADCPQ